MTENIQIKINAAVETAQAASTVGQLRKSLQELQDIAENSDLGAEQFKNLQTQIVQTSTDLAAARDRIGDMQDKISTLQGTPIERVRNSFGLLKQAIFDLDFDKARIGVEGLVNSFTPLGPDGVPLKGLAAMRGGLTNLTGAASQLGTTFINLGRTLLTNPIFLLATVITTITVGIVLLLNKLGLLQPIFDAIGKAVEYVTDSFNALTEAIGINTAATDKNLKETLLAEQQKRKAIEDTLKAQESVATAVKDLNSVEQFQVEKLTGIYVRSAEDVVQIRVNALTKLKASYQDELKALDVVAKTKRKLTDDEKKQYDEVVSKIAETNAKIVQLQADRVREVNEINQRITQNNIELEKNAYKQAQLLRDEELKQAGKNYDRKAQLLQQEKAAQEEVAKLAPFYASEQGKKEYEIAVNNKLRIRKEIDAISTEEFQLRTKAEEKYNSTINQLNEDASKKRQEQAEKNIQTGLDRIKARQESELAQAEGFEIKQLEIRNKYIKLIEEYQLNNSNFFFKIEEQKTAFIDKNNAERSKNEQKINEIIQERADLLKENEIVTRANAELTELEKKKALAGDELELARLRIQLTLERDLADLRIAQAKDQSEKNKLEAEALLKIEQIKTKIRDIDVEAVKKIQADTNLEIQRELNALETLLAAQIKFDQDKLKSRQDVINFVKTLEGKSEEELKQMRTATAEDQINLLRQIQLVKEKQIAEDELTLQLEKSNIQDFADFKRNLAELSVNEQKEFNVRRLQNEKETSDAVIQLTKEEVEQKRIERLKERDDMIGSAGMALSAIQKLTNLSFDIKRKQLKKGSKEDEEAAKKQFQINKALNIGTAIIQGIQSILAITSVPDFTLGVASAIRIGAQVALNAASIAAIAAEKFEYSGGGGGAASLPSLPSVNGNVPSITAIPEKFAPPTFFGLGDGGINTTVGPNQQRVYVLETDITSTQNRVSVIENRSVID